jgi:hypothetical protein
MTSSPSGGWRQVYREMRVSTRAQAQAYKTPMTARTAATGREGDAVHNTNGTSRR